MPDAPGMKREIDAGFLFDAGWYLARYPDVASSGQDPMQHYLRYGAASGRDPCALLDSLWYSDQYRDAAAGANPLIHFIRSGAAEGFDPHPALGAARWRCDSDSGELREMDEWYSAMRPEVSIVIVNKDRSFATMATLFEVWRHTRGQRYEVIVVDASREPPQFVALARFAGEFRLVNLVHRRSYGEAANIGIEEARGDVVVFLAPGVSPESDWLRPLVQALEAFDCGLAGATAWSIRSPENLRSLSLDGNGRILPSEAPPLSSPARTTCVYPACFAARRSVLRQVQGFRLPVETTDYRYLDLADRLLHLGLGQRTVESRVRLTPQFERFGRQSEEGPSATARAEAGYRPELARHGATGAAEPSSRSTARASRAVFFTPFSLIPGGGERYLITAAAALRTSHQVTIATQHRHCAHRLVQLAAELQIEVSGVGLQTLAEVEREGPIETFIAMGNELLPPVPPLGRRNIYVCQFPMAASAQTVRARWDFLNGYSEIVVYSTFVARHVARALRRVRQEDLPIRIVPPPVRMIASESEAMAGSRGNTIVAIGRFFAGGHNKRHDILIQGLRHLVGSGVTADLHLIGSVQDQPDHWEHLRSLRAAAADLPVHFHPNAPAVLIEDLLRRGALYWHAAGYGVDLELNPEQCEHFGISILEAMSAGCIVVVHPRGGPREFVTDGETGFWFETPGELADRSARVLADPAAWQALRRMAYGTAAQFDNLSFQNLWRFVIENAPASVVDGS